MRTVRGSSQGWNNLKTKSAAKKLENKSYPCYQNRKKKLTVLGYSSYQAYLKTKEWINIRTKKLQTYPNCILCNEKATVVHHMSYDYLTLSGAIDHRLIQLCHDCHRKIEFDGEYKRHLKDANRVLIETAMTTEKGKNWIKWMKHNKETLKRNNRQANKEKKRKKS